MSESAYATHAFHGWEDGANRPTGCPVFSTEHTTIVIPTLNERDNIRKLIARIFALYPLIHVLVVDDNSSDRTSAVVRALQPRYPNLMLLERMHNPGFAPAYRDGFGYALRLPWCQAIVTMDADFSHNPIGNRRDA